MIEESLAPALPARTLPDSRASRALEIFVEHFDRIAASWHRGVWKVPSSTDPGVEYTVRLLSEVYCSCPDFEGPEAECKHVMVVRVVRKKTAPCSSCGRRYRHRDLEEVTEDHESLTWFPGDRLCLGCIDACGGIS